MKACFLLHELGRAGGMRVVTGHVERLAQREGIDVEIVLTGAALGEPGDARVRPLADARGEEYDIAIATWWETAAALYDLRARRRALFVQSLEERFYREDELFDRLGAASVLGLPLHFIAVASWIGRILADLRPDAHCAVVRNGIDKDVFSTRRPTRREGPLRVLVEGQPELWFKGIRESLDAVRAMREPAQVTLITPAPCATDGLGADHVRTGLDPAGMARAYADADVVVKLARVEGLGLVPIEAFHAGVPCVVAPYTGHEEYVLHGVNGLVVGYDDIRATAAALDRLATDRDLLERLSRGALAAAADWPSPQQSTDELEAALREIAAAPEPAPEPSLGYMLRRMRLAMELGRTQIGTLRGMRDALAHERANNYALIDRSEAAERALAEVQATRAYRAAVAARSVLDRVRR